MAAVTVASLITDAQTISDIGLSSFISSAEWLGLVNDAYRALWNAVVAANPDFRVTNQSFSITDTTVPFVALPADYMDTRAVIRDYGLQSEEILTKETFRASRRQNRRSYRVDGVNLVIEPYQMSAGNYTHRYNPDAPVLAAPDSTDAELGRFSEFLKLHMAVKARIKDESPSDSLVDALWGSPGRKRGAIDDVREWAAQKRSADPDKPEDVRPRRKRGWPSRWPA
jgi:hypothetical protein